MPCSISFCPLFIKAVLIGDNLHFGPWWFCLNIDYPVFILIVSQQIPPLEFGEIFPKNPIYRLYIYISYVYFIQNISYFFPNPACEEYHISSRAQRLKVSFCEFMRGGHFTNVFHYHEPLAQLVYFIFAEVSQHKSMWNTHGKTRSRLIGFPPRLYYRKNIFQSETKQMQHWNK